ncbi:pentatricopeptide repeat-containing protein, partial [Trifolium medium]|nr:pentatricopeptide repeat-containing protein [Trifolium medium]
MHKYCQNGHYDDALRLFEDMKSSNMKPDSFILCTVLSACGHAGNLSYGRTIHEFVKDNGLAI